MDILKNFKDFFYAGGLESLISQFRNPTEEEWIILDAKYIPLTDSRESFNPDFDDTVTNCKSVYPFTNWLNSKFVKIKDELRQRCEALEKIKADDRALIEEIVNDSDLNFEELRGMILDNNSINRYHNILLLFITDIEGIYKKWKNTLYKKAVAPKKIKKKIAGDECVSFRFQGSLKQIKYIHAELARYDFIDGSDTTEELFISILTTDNIYSISREIKFTCQTRQAAYIIIKLSQLCSNKEIKLYGNSGKFKSKDETSISYDSLYKESSLSKSTPLKSKDIIDKIFNLDLVAIN